MVIAIKSDSPISEECIAKVKDIFRVSHCPEESFCSSFDDFRGFNGKEIQFGDGENFTEYINVEHFRD